MHSKRMSMRELNRFSLFIVFSNSLPWCFFHYFLFLCLCTCQNRKKLHSQLLKLHLLAANAELRNMVPCNVAHVARRVRVDQIAQRINHAEAVFAARYAIHTFRRRE